MSQLFVIAALAVSTAFLTPRAYADNYVDFSCGGSACTGTVTNSGGVYSTTGIGGLVQTVSGGTDYLTGAFNLVFNTSTNAITLTGNAGAHNDTLLGSIIGFTTMSNSGSTLLSLTANWKTLPTDFSTYLGASGANSLGSVIYLNESGAAASVDFTLTPTATPEPGTIFMLGAGLLGFCGLIGRKAFSPEA
jgi:hypothetical protein